MAQSLSALYIHMVFSTKDRVLFLDDNLRDEINAYLLGILKNQGCPSIMTNSEKDHVHSLFVLPRTKPVANIAKTLKESSSQWMKGQGVDYHKFSWQRGYGAFSVSQSNVGTVTKYIAHQAEHHRRMSFQDEYRLLLEKHGIEWNEKYVWD
jgi:putative transposase